MSGVAPSVSAPETEGLSTVISGRAPTDTHPLSTNFWEVAKPGPDSMTMAGFFSRSAGSRHHSARTSGSGEWQQARL